MTLGEMTDTDKVMNPAEEAIRQTPGSESGLIRMSVFESRITFG